MLIRSVERYSRPRRPAAAFAALARGARPLAGGTRLLARDEALAEVVDLAALGWDTLGAEGHGLRLGALARLEDLAHSRLVSEGSRGLLCEAARAHSASPLLRGMASLGGEAVSAAHDSLLFAALLSLEAEAVVADAQREQRVPLEALGAALAGGGRLVSALRIPAPPDGAALQRLAVLPSAPSLVGVAVALWGSSTRVERARIAVCGLTGAPARALEAERRLEVRRFDAAGVDEAAAALGGMAFRDDAHAGAAWRRRVAVTLGRRALLAAGEFAAPAPPPVRRWMAEPQPARALEQSLSSTAVELSVNGRTLGCVVSAGTTLMALLRDQGLNGVKHGCETGECGACCAILDGRPVASCLTLAAAADGRRVETVEGLGQPGALHPVQDAFVETGAIQCGYCIPALELCAKALLDALPQPGEAEVRDALSGCLCRCTGYVKPVEAVLRAAADRA